MNHLPNQIISLLSGSVLMTIVITVAWCIRHKKTLWGSTSPGNFDKVSVDSFYPVDLLLCSIFVLYYSLGGLTAAFSSGEEVRSSSSGVNADMLLMSCLLGFSMIAFSLKRMQLTGRIVDLGLKKHSLNDLIFAPLIGLMTILGLYFLLELSGLFQWIQDITKAPAEQTIITTLRETDQPLLIFTICFSAAVVAPIAEELIFRAYLYPLLKKYTGFTFAICFTSILFGVIHASLVPMIPLALFSVILILLYERTGSIWSSISTHSLFNTGTLINILLFS